MSTIKVLVNSKEIASIESNNFIRSEVGILSANEAEDVDLLSTGYIGSTEIDNILNQKIQFNDVVDITFGEFDSESEVVGVKTADLATIDDKQLVTFKLTSSNGIDVVTSKSFYFSQHIELSCLRESEICTVLCVSMDFKGNEHNLRFTLPLNNSIRVVLTRES